MLVFQIFSNIILKWSMLHEQWSLLGHDTWCLICAFCHRYCCLLIAWFEIVALMFPTSEWNRKKKLLFPAQIGPISNPNQQKKEKENKGNKWRGARICSSYLFCVWVIMVILLLLSVDPFPCDWGFRWVITSTLVGSGGIGRETVWLLWGLGMREKREDGFLE